MNPSPCSTACRRTNFLVNLAAAAAVAWGRSCEAGLWQQYPGYRRRAWLIECRIPDIAAVSAPAATSSRMLSPHPMWIVASSRILRTEAGLRGATGQAQRSACSRRVVVGRRHGESRGGGRRHGESRGGGRRHGESRGGGGRRRRGHAPEAAMSRGQRRCPSPRLLRHARIAPAPVGCAPCPLATSRMRSLAGAESTALSGIPHQIDPAVAGGHGALLLSCRE